VRHSLPLIAVLASTACVAACNGVDDSTYDVNAVESSSAALCTPTQLKPTTAVASANPKQAAKNAIDGNTGTRWESAYSDPQWIYFDLGAVKTITEVKIDWQHAAAKDYRIDVSNDAVNWSAPVVTKTGGLPVDHRIDDLTGFSVSARYVRVYGTARATAYGYSIWEAYIYDGSCSTGAGGSGGTTGSAGSGGTTGSAGSGGTTGSAGSGGTTGSAGSSCTSGILTTPTSPVVASAGPKQAAKNAFDGKTTTRWESAYSDPQWIYVDLGSVKTITEVKIDWQHAAAKDYRIDVSNDGVNWSAPVATRTGGLPVDHRIDDIAGLSASGRYVRMYGTARATVYGYSIWEMYVYGYDAASCASNLLTAGWDRSNVTSNFTPVSGYTFGVGKNAVSFDYTGKTYSTPSAPPILTFLQSATIPQAGSKWRLTLTITGINDQTNLPPVFIALLNNSEPSTYGPTLGTVGSSSGRLIRVGQLTSGTLLTADFDLAISSGQTVQLELDNVPTFASTPDGLSGNGLQKFNVTDASLVRLQ
jgi:hypothetical protein